MGMPNHYTLLELAEIRHRDDMIAAESWRLVHRAASPDRPAPRMYRRWLVRLGETLSAWGCDLQTRYREAPVLAAEPMAPCRR